MTIKTIVEDMPDFRWLAHDIGSRPTRIAEVVPDALLYIGGSDAAGPGMGGVWLPNADSLYLATVQANTLSLALHTKQGPAVAAVVADRAAARESPTVNCSGFTLSSHAGHARDPPPLNGPILWRHKFPPEIVEQLVSFDNPSGSINNSELKLAGIIGNNDVLVHDADVVETTTATGTNNSAALSWSTKGAVSTTKPASYLLRVSAIHQRTHRYQQPNFLVLGDANGMADDCSQLWHLSDEELLAYFTSTYPQNKPWQLCHLHADTAAAIHAALLCKRLALSKTVPTLAAESLPLPERSSGAEGDAWHLQASPAAHGHRKRLFNLLGKSPNTWVTASSPSAIPARPRTVTSLAL